MCGGEGIEGTYGSITQPGINNIFRNFVKHTSMGNTSVLVDIGAGLARPLLHALLDPGVKQAFGWECDQVKVDKAETFVQRVVSKMKDNGVDLTSGGRKVPVIHCSTIEQVVDLRGATHAYSFWEGIPMSAKLAFGKLFHDSRTAVAVAVVQHSMKHPESEMANLGFGTLELLACFNVSQQYSGRMYKAYVFKKNP